MIRRIVIATGKVITIAGSAGMPGTADGVGLAARFNEPSGISFDGTNTLWIVDTQTCLIRVLAIDTQTVTTVGGVANSCVDSDTAPVTFVDPTAILFSNNVVYVGNDIGTVRAITAFGVVTIAGQVHGAQDKPPAPQSGFRGSSGLATDGAGTLYVFDAGNAVVRTVSTASPFNTTTLTAATLTGGRAAGMTYAGGKVWIADPSDNTIRSVDSGGAVTTVAGRAEVQQDLDAAFASAAFSGPIALVFDGAANIYVGEDRVRALSLSSRQATSLAGGMVGNADGLALAAKFRSLAGGVMDSANAYLFIADPDNHSIRRVAVSGGLVDTPFNTITSPMPGHVDGVGTASRFSSPADIARVGNVLYVCDAGNNAIRAIDLTTATTTTFAGGSVGSQDGVGTAAQFSSPAAITTDGANLYVNDRGNHTLRRIEIATGTVTTIAGQVGIAGVTDGIAATASFDDVSAMSWDGAGSVYLVDAANNLVRRVYVSTGAVSTFAGVDHEDGVVLGSITTAQIGFSNGIVVNAPSTIFLSATNEDSILQLVQQ